MVANNSIGALLITQHSDKDTVLFEIQENEQYYAASIYMDYNATIDIELRRIEKIHLPKERNC